MKKGGKISIGIFLYCFVTNATKFKKTALMKADK
ncbi:hypothetical protein SAMN05443253_10363 [Bacillus sp. OK048]|nr:hypothetical protein SAMN05443253_10363 [Bacillus sp. OK048]